MGGARCSCAPSPPPRHAPTRPPRAPTSPRTQQARPSPRPACPPGAAGSPELGAPRPKPAPYRPRAATQPRPSPPRPQHTLPSAASWSSSRARAPLPQPQLVLCLRRPPPATGLRPDARTPHDPLTTSNNKIPPHTVLQLSRAWDGGGEAVLESKFYPICFVAAPESDVPWEGVHTPRQGCLHAVSTARV